MARESDTVAAMRRELGRQLAARRRAGGYLQRELGVRLGFSRSTVANAEAGARVGRQLWERADQVLRTGELFTRGYDRIQARIAGESRAAAGMSPALESADQTDRLRSLSTGQARLAYLERGWLVEEDAVGQLWLLTGGVIDALEVPRTAGRVAMSWWLYTRGVPDEIRGLPALPDPAVALAAITAGSSCFFLTQAGAFPWAGQAAGAVDAGRPATRGAVRWHADGGRVPAPPSRLDDGDLVTWAHVPSAEGQLVSPMALLHVLAHAAATTEGGASLVLPGGIAVVPAATA